MKRYTLILSFLLTALMATAQTEWFAKGSAGVTDYTMDGLGPKFGHKIGVGYEKRLWNDYFYQLSLLVSTKGTSNGFDKMDHIYIEIPVLWGIDFAHNTHNNLYATAGIYGAVGIAGKSKSDDYTGNTFSNSNIWGDKLCRFDLGIVTGFGINFGKVRAGIELELGLIPLIDYGDLWKDDYGDYHYDYEPSPLNFGISATLTYKF